MISCLDNKKMPATADGYVTILDDRVGGCGFGPVGDPNTFTPEVWESILDWCHPKTVLDIGCGCGYSTRWFEQRGKTVLGVDGSQIVVDNAVTPAVHLHDFAQGKMRGDPVEWDLGWCSEFLEHVDQADEPNVFASLVCCRYVVVSAALPGFHGHHHVNEQSSQYWISRFREHGFRYDEVKTAELRAIAFNANPKAYFSDNGLAFVREQTVKPAPHWTDVGGWLDGVQGKVLQKLAAGRTVLELGSYTGRSAICMAQTAKQVTTIDHHKGDTFTGPQDTHEELLKNIRNFRMQSKIEPLVLDLADAADALEDRRFQLVYVDGQHDAESVERDTVTALHAICPGGAIVWHDWALPEVRAGVAATGIPMDHVKAGGDFAMFETARYKVAVVLPHSRVVEPESLKSAMMGCHGRTADQILFLDYPCGCLTMNFNSLLATCLNKRDRGEITHMAMLHSDIAADAGWVDVLAEEMCLKRVALMSAVVTIKDPDDDRTSTAIGVKGRQWEYGRYIRLREQPDMPQTFTGDDVCKEDDTEVLLVNTGCMLLDLSYPFWDTFHFHVDNRIRKNEQGERYAQFAPEDWLMSRALDAANIPYAATWRVKTRHIGQLSWDNRPRPGFLSNGTTG